MNNKRNSQAGSNTGAKPAPKLTDRQERFVYEYLIDQNASAAAQRAGYSAKTRGAQAAELMKMPLVRERIAIELQDLYARLKVTAFDLLQLQARIAFFDPRKMFRQGKAVPLDELDEGIASVLEVSYRENAKGQMLRQVRHPSRQRALAALERRYEQFMQMQLDWLALRRSGGVDLEEEDGHERDAEEVAEGNVEAACAVPPEAGTAATREGPQANVAPAPETMAPAAPVLESMARVAPAPEAAAHAAPAPAMADATPGPETRSSETPASAYLANTPRREPQAPNIVTPSAPFPAPVPQMPAPRLPQPPFPLAPAGPPIYGAATQLLCRGWPQPAAPDAAPTLHARPRMFGRG